MHSIIIIVISAGILDFTTVGLISKTLIKLQANNLTLMPICIYNCLHQQDLIGLSVMYNLCFWTIKLFFGAKSMRLL